MVSVDIVPLNHDGNIIDAGSIAAIAALQSTRLPAIDENGNVDYKHLSEKNAFELKSLPIAVTIGKIGENLIVDPTKEEEDSLDARLTVTVMEDGKFCSLQKGGEVGFTTEEISKIFDLAIEKSQEIRSKLL
jgi:exosome complex component RRP42